MSGLVSDCMVGKGMEKKGGVRVLTWEVQRPQVMNQWIETR